MYRSPPRLRRRRTAAAATCAWLLAIAASASAHAPNASFEFAPAQPAAGELVDFRSTTTPHPEHTETLALDWDLDGDGQFDDGSGTTARRAYSKGTHVVRLRARYPSATAGHEDVAERTLTVGGTEPVPSANQAPVAAFEKDCRKTGGFVVCVGLFFYFYPIYTAQVIPYAQWSSRMWFPSWI